MASSRRFSILDLLSAGAALAALGLLAFAAIPRFTGLFQSSVSGVLVHDWTKYASEGRQIGPTDAAVTIIEWGDYQCPVCRAWAPDVEYALAAYPETVRLIYRHWPLDIHPFAYPAARAAECAGEQGAFAEFHGLLYSNNDWFLDPLDYFQRFAELAGVPDLALFASCVRSIEQVEAIERDVMAVAEIGGTGTPTVLINGRVIRPMPDSLQLVALIADIAGS